MSRNHEEGLTRVLGLDPGEKKTGIAISDPLGVIAQGDILLHAKSAVVNGVVQSVLPDGTSTGTIDLRNEATIYGCAIAQTVQLHNKCNIFYDPSANSDITTQGEGFYKKISWQEVY